jgi:hypothetical protein
MSEAKKTAPPRPPKTPKAARPRRGSKDMQRRSRVVEQVDLPGTAADRDKILEQCGRELEAAEEERKTYDEQIKVVKARAAKRLGEIGKTIYRTGNGKLLTSTLKQVIKLQKAPKPRSKKPKVE